MVVNVDRAAKQRQNTSGGSAGAGGYSYQTEASVAVLAKILAGDSLHWADTGCTQIPTEILAETGRGGDDLQIRFESGAVVEVQAKKGVQKGEKLWAALVDLALAVTKDAHVYGVLLTDSNASHTIRAGLRWDIVRIGQGRTDDLKSITKEFLKQLDKAKINDVAACCAKLRIVVYDFDPASPGEELIQATLKGAVYDRTRIGSAHDALSREALRLIVDRGRRDKHAIENLLSAKGIAVTASSSSIPIAVQEAMSLFATSMATLSVEGTRAQEKLLVADTHGLTDNIRDAWNRRDFAAAFAESPGLRRWVSTHANQLPGIEVADAYALLVEVETNRLTQTQASFTVADVTLIEEMIGEGERALGRSGQDGDNPVEQRLFSLKSFVASLVHGPKAGLEMLATRDDPYAMRRRLAILIGAKRFDEAIEEIKNLPLNEEWAEKAVDAFAVMEHYEEVFKVIRWAKAHVAMPMLSIICAIAASDAVYKEAVDFGLRATKDAFAPLPTEESTRLTQALAFLTEVTKGPKANQQVHNELEVGALHREAVMLARLGDREALRPVVTTLESWKPLPPILPDLAQYGFWPCGHDWPDRMRLEYPGNFEIEVLASLITPDAPECRQTEFDRLSEIALRVSENGIEADMRRIIYAHLALLASGLDGDATTRLATIEIELLGDDERARLTMKMVRLVNAGQFDEAEVILDGAQDDGDPMWLQCRAAIAVHHGKSIEALDYLRQALSTTSHPGLLRQTAEVALEAGQPTEAVAALERYLGRKPDDDAVRHQLALLYVDNQEFGKAAQQFEAIWQHAPHEISRAINYAASLAHAGDLNRSVQVYEEACGGEDPPLQALIALSSVLKALGRPKAAFERLFAHRDRWWEEPQYLMAVSNIGYAAAEEKIAFEALAQVQRLQAQGKADEDLIRTFSLDEAVKMFVERRKSVEEAQGFVLRCQLPWLCIDRMFNQTAIESWHNRTRHLGWIGEMPIAQAMTAVYATNSFFIDRKADRNQAYRSLPTPQPNSPAVADLSALLTLHQLGLLDAAADFFGQILLPSAYSSVDLQDAGKLVLHQLSQKVEMEAIREATDVGRILVVPSLEADQIRVTELHDSEYDENTVPFTYGLNDVLPLLLMEGLITDQQLLDNSHLMRHISLAQTPLTCGQKIAVNVTLLKALAGASLLEALLDGFRVVMTEHDRETVTAGLRAFKQQEEMYREHHRLWEQIRSDTRFAFMPYSRRSRATTGEEFDPRQDLEIASALLAQERGLPLLADDRVCQAIIYGDPLSPPSCYAFGTDCLLIAWSETGKISPEQAADSYLQLIRWRYRFLIPPAEVLKSLAMKHISHPPGKEIREIANYVHDCMRDAGLPLEQASEKPISAIANWICLNWITTLVKFVSLLWIDSAISSDKAACCTDWAIRHMLPSPPRIMGAAGGHFLNDLPRFIMKHALLLLFMIKDTGRGRQALQTISNALGIPKDRYMRVASEAMDEL
ncbi:tetratricopeptide repeat protein [Armatimonas sp.]|uniref:tetratricopeptide repeat protein n=1 Tax=Armatimonas sp. TaxID=1872638 RepID=UPI00374CA9BC